MADPDYHAAKRQGYEWGVKEERERIIALLEKTDRLKTIEQGVLVNYAEEAIDLIRENSER